MRGSPAARIICALDQEKLVLVGLPLTEVSWRSSAFIWSPWITKASAQSGQAVGGWRSSGWQSAVIGAIHRPARKAGAPAASAAENHGVRETTLSPQPPSNRARRITDSRIAAPLLTNA